MSIIDQLDILIRQKGGKVTAGIPSVSMRRPMTSTLPSQRWSKKAGSVLGRSQ
jgi:hypothetical protein